MSNIISTTNNTLLPSPNEFALMERYAEIAVLSKLLPFAINTKEKALIIMLKGRELNIPPMQAFAHIHVINGKPAMSAELMLAQIYKTIPNVVINFLVSNDKECTLEAKRPNGDKIKWSFTVQEAEAAKLLGKDVWQLYRPAMLRARCISIMARAMFPDSLMGVSYTPEELGAEIDYDSEGNEIVKDVTPDKGKDKDKKPAEENENNKPKENTEVISKPVTKPLNEAPCSTAELTTLGNRLELIGGSKHEIKHLVFDMFGIELKFCGDLKLHQYETLLSLITKSNNLDELRILINQFIGSK